MRFEKMIIILITTVLLLAGCQVSEENLSSVPGLEFVSAGESQLGRSDKTMAQRFTEPGAEMEDADMLGNVLMWSKKYEELLKKNDAEKDMNRLLKKEKEAAEHKLALAELDLDRTKKELADAVAFMGEQESELSKWRADVLGNREEIEKIHKAQLNALRQIKILLGAEVIEDSENSDQ